MNLDSDSPISPLPTNQGKPSDRINEVPDDILSSILSLLSIKDATKARVLSRRWRYLCPSILHLSLDFHTLMGINYDAGEPDISPQDMCKFVTRVDQFLELYNVQTLDSLKVDFCLGSVEYTSHIDGWVRSAIRMKTKRLDLAFSPRHHRNKLYDFRCHLLLQAETSQLKHLHLKICNLSLAPHLVFSPISLTKLDLEFVRLDQITAESILSGCLNIQWLSLQYCDLPETLCIHGPSLHLKTLIVFNCIDVSKIEISSVGLTSFEYTGRVIQFTFIDVCHLDKVHLGFLSAHVNVKQYLFYGLPKDLPQLQTLSLGLTANEVLSVPGSISRFNYLKQLDVFIWRTLNCDLLFLTSILNASPILQKFYLAVLETAPRDPRRIEQPYCKLIHYQLKEVEVSGFNGHPDEVELVIYLLNNVVSLEKMTLNPKTRVYNTSRYKRRCDLPWVEEERKEAYDLLRKEKFNSPAKLILL